MNRRFADWYYVISDDVYQKIRLNRSDIVKPAEQEDEWGFRIYPADLTQPWNLRGGGSAPVAVRLLLRRARPHEIPGNDADDRENRDDQDPENLVARRGRAAEDLYQRVYDDRQVNEAKYAKLFHVMFLDRVSEVWKALVTL